MLCCTRAIELLQVAMGTVQLTPIVDGQRNGGQVGPAGSSFACFQSSRPGHNSTHNYLLFTVLVPAR